MQCNRIINVLMADDKANADILLQKITMQIGENSVVNNTAAYLLGHHEIVCHDGDLTIHFYQKRVSDFSQNLLDKAHLLLITDHDFNIQAMTQIIFAKCAAANIPFSNLNDDEMPWDTLKDRFLYTVDPTCNVTMDVVSDEFVNGKSVGASMREAANSVTDAAVTIIDSTATAAATMTRSSSIAASQTAEQLAVTVSRNINSIVASFTRRKSPVILIDLSAPDVFEYSASNYDL